MLFIGLETGQLMAWSMKADLTWQKVADVAPFYGHSLSVRRIKFNVRFSKPDENEFTVATCANDQSVRIFRILLN